MPRITCPGNADCFIDCPGSGYAYYVKPYGPCECGCDEVRAASALLEVIRDLPPDGRTSGAMIGLRLRTLIEFAGQVSPYAPPEASDALTRLRRITIVEDRRINAFWEDADVVEVIETLAGAASGTAPRVAVA